MSFRTIHQPYFEVISIFSNAPISKNKQGKFHRSIAKCVYSVLLTICLDVYFIKVLVDQVISHFVNRESNGLTLMIVFSSRQICSSLTFAYIMLVCVGVARSHADLLNLLIDLERSVDEHKVRFNCTHSNAKPRWMESNWPAATLVVWNISVNALMSKIYDINEGTHIDVLLVWIASMQFCIVLYVRMLMTLLTSNCRQLRGCFVHSHRSMLASDLVILDQVADAKNVLIHAFGGILLVNFFYDVITVLVTTFWAIFTLANYGASNHVVDMAFVLGGYTIPFVSKVFLVTNAAEGLAAEVDEIRKIAVKASTNSDKQLTASLELLLLKLQHMEKTKYISANDFFPINYSMLFNMAAAIVTHMLVLLQFQQWEDSQNTIVANGTDTAN